jgi:hypothetical protein
MKTKQVGDDRNHTACSRTHTDYSSRVAHFSRYRQCSGLHRCSCVICFAETTASGILSDSPEIVRKHYAKWSPARQARIDDLIARVHTGENWAVRETTKHVQ